MFGFSTKPLKHKEVFFFSLKYYHLFLSTTKFYFDATVEQYRYCFFFTVHITFVRKKIKLKVIIINISDLYIIMDGTSVKVADSICFSYSPSLAK